MSIDTSHIKNEGYLHHYNENELGYSYIFDNNDNHVWMIKKL